MKKKRLLRLYALLKSQKKTVKIMNLNFLFVVLVGLNLSANVYSQQNKVSLKLDGVTVEEFIDAVKAQTGVNFLYNSSLFSNTGRVSVDAKAEPLDAVLKRTLEKQGFVFDFENDVVVIRQGNKSNAKELPADKKTIKGVVKDASGPLPGVSVMIKGTLTGISSDIDGRFELKAGPEDVLVFSFIGMKSKEVAVGTATELTVSLEPDAQTLDEVVVTGYQTLSKERATGSFSVVTAKDYGSKLQTSVMDRLEGMVAGLVSYNDKIQIRGVSTVYGNKTPLYVVDGMPYEGSIDAINPSDVSNVTVLKDATAASIYGARAANGVIVITTRQGQEGKLNVSYNGSVRFQPVPDVDYLKKINSSELVDMQIAGFNYYHQATPNKRYAQNEVIELLYQNARGEISASELDQQLNYYRTHDRRDQVKDELLRTAVKHQHNLSLSGGNEKNRYMVSVNYLGDYSNEKTISKERIGFNLKDNLKLTKWLTADLGINGSFTNSGGDNGIQAQAISLGNPYIGDGKSGAFNLYSSGPTYLMLRDEQNNPRALRKNKSAYELDRLNSIGLMDETYVPLDELSKANLDNRSSYYKLQAAFNVKLMEGLSVDLKYQNENTSIKNRQLFDKNAYYVRNMVNEATEYDKETGELTLNIPKGGQLQESRADIYSYTMRAQVNFDRTFKEKHAVNALIGGERRLVRTTSTNTYRFGYDENSLNYKPIDPVKVGSINGTESVGGYFGWNDQSYNNYFHDEDRYIAFYGNASYTYNSRYALTGSIRMDQSNLFGTDPKYQYRPLWSVGVSWFAVEEDFMKNVDWLNRLNVRLTYGINGNISKESGPYLTVADEGYSTWTNDFGASILNPPNPQLRWEKTTVTNFGIDFSVLNSRLGGSIDYYNKRSTELLGYRETDPTLGWSSLLLNYGTLSNSGLELSLNSVNIHKGDFEWTSVLNFSYNKNKLIRLNNKSNDVFSYVKGNVNTQGRPLNSLFSYRWAGLNPENGNPLVYDENGEKKNNVQNLEALTYSGTTIPPYSVSLSNRIQYKGIALSFMFIYNGGHILRDAVEYLSGAPGNNISRRSLNYWKKPGDEKNPDVIPSMNRSANYRATQVWYAADVNVLKADYIKLRELSLSYELPKQLINKWNLSSMTVNLQVNNVWWWAANDKGIDPEAYSIVGYGTGSRTLPNPTTYTLGVAVNF